MALMQGAAGEHLLTPPAYSDWLPLWTYNGYDSFSYENACGSNYCQSSPVALDLRTTKVAITVS